MMFTKAQLILSICSHGDNKSSQNVDSSGSLTTLPPWSLSILFPRHIIYCDPFLFVSFSNILHTPCSYPFPLLALQLLFSLCRKWLYDTANGICNFMCAWIRVKYFCATVRLSLCVCLGRSSGRIPVLVFLCVRFSSFPRGCVSVFLFTVQRHSA